MIDQERLTAPECRTNPEERTAGSAGMREPDTGKRSYVDMVTLIRSIQRAEGNPDCFRRPQGDCHETECWWRPYCMEGEYL